MPFYRSIDYYDERKEDTERWEYVFLHSASNHLPLEDMDKLMWNIVDMEKRGDKSRTLDTNSFRARVKKDNPTSFESFSGTPFYATLEIGGDKTDDMGIFLLKHFYPTYSRN